jgi:hypothetical protein
MAQKYHVWASLSINITKIGRIEKEFKKSKVDQHKISKLVINRSSKTSKHDISSKKHAIFRKLNVFFFIFRPFLEIHG